MQNLRKTQKQNLAQAILNDAVLVKHLRYLKDKGCPTDSILEKAQSILNCNNKQIEDLLYSASYFKAEALKEQKYGALNVSDEAHCYFKAHENETIEDLYLSMGIIHLASQQGDI